MSAPTVYSAITAVAGDLAKKGVPKNQTNAEEQYQFRGIDDLYNRLSPALAAHKLCILPRVLERSSVERHGMNGALLVSVTLKVAFDIVSAEDGSAHVIESYGEALDAGDKATSKAMTAAFKYALIQAFCIPIVGSEDADASSPKLMRAEHVPEPVQGWERWTSDISDVVRVCETGEALDRLQNMNRALFKGISRERPDLYSRIGETIRERRTAIAHPKEPPASPPRDSAEPRNSARAKRSGGAPRKPKGSARIRRSAKHNGGEAHA